MRQTLTLILQVGKLVTFLKSDKGFGQIWPSTEVREQTICQLRLWQGEKYRKNLECWHALASSCHLKQNPEREINFD